MNPVNIFAEAERVKKDGVKNNCINGECIGCGDCCSGLLPISSKERKRIQQFVTANKIKMIDHAAGFPLLHPPKDMTCPFLDLNAPMGKRCLIYPVRPKICQQFKCDQPIEVMKANRDFLRGKYETVVMRNYFKEG